MSTIEHAALCEQGPVRDNNEDFIVHRILEDPAAKLEQGHLFAVADGVGGSQAGEIASKEAAETLVDSYYESGKKPGRALQDAFVQANMRVFDLAHAHPEYRRMQTTLCALAIVGDQAHMGHIGDSRIYRVRGGEAVQLTRDHSEVGELVRIGVLTPDEARHHPRRNIITRSIGSELIPQPDFKVETVETGDTFILCTDGLWEPVDDAVMAEVVTKSSPAAACRTLVDLAIAGGTEDNLTLQVIKVLAMEPGTESEPNGGLLKRVWRILGPKPV